ncbi:MAG: helix-turn-helix domain-containing protein [Dysgonomonas sp.]
MPINFLKQIIQQKGILSENGDWIRRSPSKVCEDYIEGFYLFYEINSESEHWVFNDGSPSIILFPQKDNRVCINIDNKSEIIESGWIDAGVIKKVYVKYIEDLEYILVIRFKPESFYKLFKLDPLFFRHRNIATFSDINFPIELFDTIFTTNSIKEKINLIEFFIMSLMPENAKTGLLNSAIELINRTKGQISVSDVLRHVNVNYKWLERNFTKYLGLTPKEYIQLQRFISAYIGLHNQPNDLLNVAVTSGYYDYNHFLKEFKDFTGKTPIEYIYNKEY